ncbi:hypothetical protein Syun_010263 [Stephania yunnanensis]|uniref:NAD-dependent epimerase/dehydratase domain-containing protein n=1 Tax=Stephania yunnanensis TaxID=152371 RepID=A0AAP0KI05_9MAGN
MKACVTGGTGYIASLLVKCLLEKGYAVNTTARDLSDNVKVSHLLELQKQYSMRENQLRIFQADLKNEGSFEAAVAGCDIVFHVATPVNFGSLDPENDMIKPAIQGTLDVLRACKKAKMVKRVVLTSSAAAVSIKNSKASSHEHDLVVDEERWTDVEFLASEKPPGWGYPVSKSLAEKAAWKYAEENHIDLITVIPSLVAGPAITSKVPSSIPIAMSLVTGNESLIKILKSMEQESGSISITHVEDVVQAHIFLATKESASGRYICCAVNSSIAEIVKFLKMRYPQYHITTDFEEIPAKTMLSSEKLVKEGFHFKYGIDEIYDQSIQYFKEVGILQK